MQWHVATDPRRPAKAAAILKKGVLIKKRKTAPWGGAGAWTFADFEELLEVAALHGPRFLTQQFLGAERRIRGTKRVLDTRAALVRQLERIQHILRRTWAERRRRAAGHRAAVAAAAAGCRGCRGPRRQQLEGAFAAYREERRGLLPLPRHHITAPCKWWLCDKDMSRGKAKGAYA